MGCDIHVAFETQNADGHWDLTFPPKPSDWWTENVIDEMIDNGSAALVMRDNGRNPETSEEMKAFREQLEAELKTVPDERVLEKYGHHKRFDLNFNLPEQPKPGSSWPYRISTRDYNFFGFVAKGVRGDHPQGYEPRDLPNDTHAWIRRDYMSAEGDHHNQSWLMVDELLGNPALESDFKYVKGWLETYIKEPSKTRMVFWFDN